MKTIIFTLMLTILSLNTYANVCSSNNICVNSKMPLWSQSDSSLRTYINQQEGLSVTSDPGWCGMVSAAMFLRGIALDRQSRAKMDSDWDASSKTSKSNNYFILKAGKLVKTDLADGGTRSSNARNAFIKIRDDKDTYKKKVLMFRDNGEMNYEVWENILTTPQGIKSRIKKYRQASYISVGIYDKKTKRVSKRLCTWRWKRWRPRRICRTIYYNYRYYERDGGHAMVINGYEGSAFKIYDPWGRIYNVKLRNSTKHFDGSRVRKKMTFKHVAGSGQGFAESRGAAHTLFLDSYISWSLK